MAEDIGVLDGTIPLIHGEPWTQDLTFYVDNEVTVKNLTGTTLSAEMRWQGNNELTVSTALIDAANGQARLTLTAAQTATLPLGRVVTLFVQLTEGGVPTTWFRADVDVKEGLSS